MFAKLTLAAAAATVATAIDNGKGLTPPRGWRKYGKIIPIRIL